MRRDFFPNKNQDDDLILKKLQMAKAAIDLDNYEEAYKLYHEVLEINPNHLQAINGMGSLCLYPCDESLQEQCANFLEEKAREFPDEPDIHLSLAIHYIFHEDPEIRYRGEEEIKLLCELLPEFYLAWWLRGLYYSKEKKDYWMGIDYLEKALALWKSTQNTVPSAILLNDLANMYIKLNRDDKAISLLKRQIDIDPYFCSGYSDLAKIYQKKGWKDKERWILKRLFENITFETHAKGEFDWYWLPDGLKTINEELDYAKERLAILENS